MIRPSVSRFGSPYLEQARVQDSRRTQQRRAVIVNSRATENGVAGVLKKAFSKSDEDEVRFRWNPAQSRSEGLLPCGFIDFNSKPEQ